MESKQNHIKLTFKGPFHFDDLETNGQIKNHPEDFEHPNKPGIYIWGFMYSLNSDSKALEDPIDFNPRPNEKKYCEETMQFIPYYVGLADEIMGGIFGRLKKHQKVRNGDAAKYKRFSPAFYKEFFIKGRGFEPNTSDYYKGSDKRKCNKYYKNDKCGDCPYKKIALSDKSKLFYTNVKNCMKIIHGAKAIEVHEKEARDYPIAKYNIIEEDYLFKLVGNEPNKSSMNNFWFCYAVPDISDDDKKNILEHLETYTFWSLKGMTISATGVYLTILKNVEIIDETKTGIFKETHSEDFPGYIGQNNFKKSP